ncbi:MAG TPA: hypothetical protein VFZ32_20605 [Micromonosporaceae bacterium]
MQSLTPDAESRRRPAVVTVAAALMLLVAVLGVVSAVIALAVMGGIRDAMLEALAEQDQQMADAASGLFTISMVVGIGFSLLPAVAFAVLSFFLLRGANAARITTWAVTGLFLLCGACLLALQGLGNFTPQGDPNSETIARALEDATPGWYTASEIVISIVELFAYIAIIVLLALPAANTFFAKPVPQWYPPAEFGGPVQPSGPIPGGPMPGGPMPTPPQAPAPPPPAPPPAPQPPTPDEQPAEQPPTPPVSGETPPEAEPPTR